MKIFYAIIFAWVLFQTSAVGAYETETHAVITAQAYSNSVLSPAQSTNVLAQFGLDRLDPLIPFTFWDYPTLPNVAEYYNEGGTFRLDPSANFEIGPDDQGAFERCQMQEILSSNTPNGVLFSTTTHTVEDKNQPAKIYSISNWLVRGAIREDDLGGAANWFVYHGSKNGCAYAEIANESGPSSEVRVFNHFYDPIHDAGLSYFGPVTLYGITFGIDVQGKPSVDWALGYVDSFSYPPAIDNGRGNFFSYEDARDNLYAALTKETIDPYGHRTTEERKDDSREREYRWATAFRALGDTVHLLQDTAQPQHTRNDYHGPGSSTEATAFEYYTNARVLGTDLTNYDSPYLNDFFGTSSLTHAQLPGINYGSYGPVTFATPERFFSTRADGGTVDGHLGLADYSNRGFFSAGTLPGTYGAQIHPLTFDEPSAPPTGYVYETTHLCVALANADARVYLNTVCGHYEKTVTDSVRGLSYQSQEVLPSGFTMPNVPLATNSILTTPSGIAGITINAPQYAMGIEELQASADLAIPRAVGYSTGLLNYFFRGSIEVTPPPNGLIAVVDDATPHTQNPDGYPCLDSDQSDGCKIYGFTQVVLNIRNNTADIVESGTTGPTFKQYFGGKEDADGNFIADAQTTVKAVARYHRNGCYQADLSGEQTKDYLGHIEPIPQCTPGYRTDYQEISVSAPLSIDPNTLNASQSSTQVFDFSADPIPTSATDLFIQVVYRGMIGREVDGIAVGTLDVSEPNYYTIWNNTDKYDLNHLWVDPAQATGYTDSAPTPITLLGICMNHQLAYVLSTGPGTTGIPPASFIRIAFISAGPQTMSQVVETYGNISILSESQAMTLRQANFEYQDTPDFVYNPLPTDFGRDVTLGDWWGFAYEFYPDAEMDVDARSLAPLTGPIAVGSASATQMDPDDYCQ